MIINSTSPFNRSDWIVIGGSAVTVVLAGVTRYLGGGESSPSSARHWR